MTKPQNPPISSKLYKDFRESITKMSEETEYETKDEYTQGFMCGYDCAMERALRELDRLYTNNFGADNEIK